MRNNCEQFHVTALCYETFSVVSECWDYNRYTGFSYLLMELGRQQSDLTDTAKRALATNRGQLECLKSTYGLLESEYKNKCCNLNAEQARFLRFMKTKLPAIKVSTVESELSKPKFLTTTDSPHIGNRSTVTLPVLLDRRRRSKSFSDLSEALSLNELESPRDKTTGRQKSCENLYNEKLGESRINANTTLSRSWTALDSSSNLPAKRRTEKQLGQPFGSAANKTSFKNFVEPSRKVSSPARLVPLDINRVHETRKSTSKKPIEKQLGDVKDLRYLRSGKYTTEDDVSEETI